MEFQESRDTKLERFLHRNQHTQRKLLNFEFWTNGEPQNLQKSKCLKLIILMFQAKKLRKIRMIFESQILALLTARH